MWCIWGCNLFLSPHTKHVMFRSIRATRKCEDLFEIPAEFVQKWQSYGRTRSQLPSHPKCLHLLVCVTLPRQLWLFRDGLKENNFLFDELLLESVRRLPSRFCQIVRWHHFWAHTHTHTHTHTHAHTHAQGNCVEIFQIHSGQTLLIYAPPAWASLFFELLVW